MYFISHNMYIKNYKNGNREVIKALLIRRVQRFPLNIMIIFSKFSMAKRCNLYKFSHFSHKFD
jgi:hypothetical protein